VEIIGKRPSGFTTADGTKIEGVTLYLAETMTTPGAEGKSAERVFLSKNKLSALDFTPTVGMEVDVLYNKFGKVATMKINDLLDLD